MILYQEQHGFRKQHSCKTQLLEAINDQASTLNTGGQTDLILLDFTKALDKISHTISHLLHKRIIMVLEKILLAGLVVSLLIEHNM